MHLNSNLKEHNIGIEEEIGNYNGKTLYRKRYHASGLSLTSATVIDSSINGNTVDSVLSLTGTASQNNGTYYYQVPWMFTSNRYVDLYITTDGVRIGPVGITVNSYDVEIVYTKA